MKKIVSFMLIGAMSLGIFVGCTKPQPDEKKPEETVITEPGEKQETPGQEEKEVKKAEGIYTGQIDGNSIEVKINGEPMAFWRVGVGELVSDLKGKEKVRVEYTEEESGQLKLINLEKID